MALLFISSVVPDEKDYRNEAFNRSGNNVLLGICQTIPKGISCENISFQPIPSYPHGKLWVKEAEKVLPNGTRLTMKPFVNLKLVKEIQKGLSCLHFIPKWKHLHKNEPCEVLVYNIYSPAIPLLYFACKIAKVKLYAILYDLGIPPKRLGLGKLSRLGYKVGEYFARKYIPKLDGRIVINENIVTYYAPGKDYLLIDGGVNETVEKLLFPLHVSEVDTYTFVCAGMLWDQNGTKLVLDAMKINDDPRIRIVFAGKGNDVPLIEKASKEDDRIKYAGMLSTEELFKVYEDSDVLLNLRIEEPLDFHFPSKLLEYMVTGKFVLSTPVAHAERDYSDYLFFLREFTPIALSQAFNDIMKMSKKELYEQGLRARKYMMEHRTWRERTKEIMKYIGEYA